jgi:hypothetical protein
MDSTTYNFSFNRIVEDDSTIAYVHESETLNIMETLLTSYWREKGIMSLIKQTFSLNVV